VSRTEDPAHPRLTLRSAVYGPSDVDLDDPAELYHEASKISPALARRQTQGIVRLAHSPALQAAALRSVRRNLQLPVVELPPAAPLEPQLGAVLAARRSARELDGRCLRLSSLATLLDAGYGTSAPGRRVVPSGGALYPLELYPVLLRVAGASPGVFHFDPVRRVLEILRLDDVRRELERTSAFPELVRGTAAVVFLTGVFWRTRFKYGLRGYRFALLEAGHVAQNVLLAATARGVPALPLGGFYDARVEELLDVDGVDESPVYAIALGGDGG
jgi:SagB-type dehydrogenase family enzyme